MPIQLNEIELQGLPVCRGITLGYPYFLNRNEPRIIEIKIDPKEVESEIERYRASLRKSRDDIKQLQNQLEKESALEGLIILEAQLEMLQDPLMTTEVELLIRSSLKNSDFILQQLIQQYGNKFKGLKDPFFRERFKDLQDLAKRILTYLNNLNQLALQEPSERSILCTMELNSFDAAAAHPEQVSGFITQYGGATSHTAIIAKAKGIAYITNIDLSLLKEHLHLPIIMDGRTGKVILNPSDETMEHYEEIQNKMKNNFKALQSLSSQPAETSDGFPICVSANVEITQDIDLVYQFGGQGIGLFRSEYIFLPKNEIPSEDEQFRIYNQVVKAMKGLPVVIRTFDLGGDKQHSFAAEKNPFLGCRATRFLLNEKGVFKTQLRAILRANQSKNVSILFPMISTLSELREAKRMLFEANAELGLTKKIRIGCMIEVPSAALIADHFAKECDFLSIGTNDLMQYSLAIDRNDPLIGDIYHPIDPSVIRMIKMITNEANKQQIPVTVCGEMASDPRFTPLLLGLGVQELSVTPRHIPEIKQAIRQTSIVAAVQLADQALNLATAQDVLQLLKENEPEDMLY